MRPISISLSPNVEPDDVKLASSLLFKKRVEVSPRQACLGETSTTPALELEGKFRDYLGVKAAYSFNSGRSALMAVLQGLELEKGSEVLLQAFTCNAAANPIIWSGLQPVYVDCDQNYNLSVEDLKKKITPKSRVVMIQHTFGLPADIDAIQEVCNEHNLILIEDCAHSLGAIYKGKPIGTFGEAAFFSFSRDKIISCVYGGVAVTNNEALAKKIATFQEKAGYPSDAWTNQQLLHPILMDKIILPTYSFFGRYLLVLFQWLNVLSKAIHWKEKRGMCPNYFPKRLPDKLALLAINQLKKLERFNDYRRELAKFYRQELSDCVGPTHAEKELRGSDPRKNSGFVLPNELPDTKPTYLRFAIRHNDAAKIIKKAWRKNLLLGDWYRTPVDPFDTLPDTVNYKKGSCPNAESFAGKMINLPTHINIRETEAKKIIEFIKKLPSQDID